ncbi:MAG TPA: hypothetical protein VMB46_03820, partial [Methanomassiliicoccales archaeon]|nr:hypothetical protein [Methanomassiliicoccales archaeon]
GSYHGGPEESVIEAASCPFAGDSGIVGRQFEAFANGICSAIDDRFVVTLEQGMCMGDGSCRYRIALR